MNAQDIRTLFDDRFGRAPHVVASAPGRVNLIGEHTDYNGGEVLPIAIRQRTWIAAAPRTDGRWWLWSAFERETGGFDAGVPGRSGKWWDYVAGVAAELSAMGIATPALDVAIASDVPPGAGLSSSAALEVAAAFAMLALHGSAPSYRGASPGPPPAGTIPAERIALACQRAENSFVGVPCGIMDQFASTLARQGRALHVWCDRGTFSHVPMGANVLIFDTMVSRSLRSSAYQARRSECAEALARLRLVAPTLRTLAEATPDLVRSAGLPEPLERRALHVTEETRRVSAVADALTSGGVVPGELLLASHASLRDQYECSCAELDWFVDRVMRVATREGGSIRGARMTGAGWGGCAIAVGDADALAAAAPALAHEYQREFGRAPRTWLTTAGSGARVEAV